MPLPKPRAVCVYVSGRRQIQISDSDDDDDEGVMILDGHQEQPPSGIAQRLVTGSQQAGECVSHILSAQSPAHRKEASV